MQQFFQCMNDLYDVTEINAIEYNIFNCNTFLNEARVKKWQILSVKKVEEQQIFMVFKSINRTDMTTMIFPTSKATTYCRER